MVAPLGPYAAWKDTCDTLHAHTQVLGKLCVALAPHEPQLQHAALRLTARGWETRPLPAPDGSGAFVAGLDLHRHEAFAEHSDGRAERVRLTPDRPVGEVTRELLDGARRLAGEIRINPTPQEVDWTVPLDEDAEHATYDEDSVAGYFDAATRAALVLAEYRAPYRGRSTPVNAWWGSFDLAVNLFAGDEADPPSDDFIMRNSMNAKDVTVGWWPGDARIAKPAYFSYAHPAPADFAQGKPSPEAAYWHAEMGLFLLDWEDVLASDDPHATGLEFARWTFRHACAVCGWDPELAASAEGEPPPVA
ncbi:MAG TPA: DUF5996 family protein [Thermoleophilaceae bacterium]